jgi:hypothetical protein
MPTPPPHSSYGMANANSRSRIKRATGIENYLFLDKGFGIVLQEMKS